MDDNLKKLFWNAWISQNLTYDLIKKLEIKKNESFEDGCIRIKKEKEMVTIKEENKKDLNSCKRCTHKGICKYEEDALIFVNQMDVFYKNNAPKDFLLTYDVKCELFKDDSSAEITITDPNYYNIAKPINGGDVYLNKKEAEI